MVTAAVTVVAGVVAETATEPLDGVETTEATIGDASLGCDVPATGIAWP